MNYYAPYSNYSSHPHLLYIGFAHVFAIPDADVSFFGARNNKLFVFTHHSCHLNLFIIMSLIFIFLTKILLLNYILTSILIILNLLSAVLTSASELLIKCIPPTCLPFEYFPFLFLQSITET